MRFPLRPQYASRYVDLARLLVRYGRSDLVAGMEQIVSRELGVSLRVQAVPGGGICCSPRITAWH
ncbi:MAG: hypothetical protein QOE71_1779 [Pseudonocardiales bacterium]|jgi:hypothetical protein|nr:hypothetical protein [Pseudonocardiales bacterium]